MHGVLHRVIVEWRATARILADAEQTEKPTIALPHEDRGWVEKP